MNASKEIQSLAKYFGVFAAALVFASWALNTAMVERAKGSESSMREMVRDREFFQRFAAVLTYQRNIEKTLASFSKADPPPALASDPSKA